MAPGVMISRIKSPFPPLLYQDTFSMSGPGTHPTFPTLYHRKRSLLFPLATSRLLQPLDPFPIIFQPQPQILEPYPGLGITHRDLLFPSLVQVILRIQTHHVDTNLKSGHGRKEMDQLGKAPRIHYPSLQTTTIL